MIVNEQRMKLENIKIKATIAKETILDYVETRFSELMEEIEKYIQEIDVYPNDSLNDNENLDIEVEIDNKKDTSEQERLNHLLSQKVLNQLQVVEDATDEVRVELPPNVKVTSSPTTSLTNLIKNQISTPTDENLEKAKSRSLTEIIAELRDNVNAQVESETDTGLVKFVKSESETNTQLTKPVPPPLDTNVDHQEDTDLAAKIRRQIIVSEIKKQSL